MPVKITFGKKKVVTTESSKALTGSQKPSEALKAALPLQTAPEARTHAPVATKRVSYDLSSAEKVGAFSVLGAMTLDPPKDGRLFIVHRIKQGIWYEVLEHDDMNQTLKLRSRYGTVFASNPKLAEPKFYAAVIGPEELAEPSEPLIYSVQGTPD